MDKRKIFNLISHFETEMGEDFIDQNESIIKESCLVFWLLGKGYLNKHQVDIWSTIGKCDVGLNSLLGGYQDDYSLFPHGEGEEECYTKRNEILAELISELSIYESRLMDIMNEFNCMENFIDGQYDECYEKISKITAEELNLKYIDD